MKQYKAYCFDLDGTVYKGKTGIASAVEFIQQLQSQGIEPFYVTNNSSKTREQLHAALAQIDLHVPLDHIYSSALTTAKYISQHFPNQTVEVFGADGIKAALVNEGITIVSEQPNVLVMGIDRQLDYAKLAQAALTVQQGAILIGTNPDIKFPTEVGFAPGNGSFVQLVANVANVEPLFIGKPSPLMLEVIASEHQLSKEQMVMIGDNYDTDIMCGINFGCDTVHVNTGVTPTVNVLQKQLLPTYVVENLLFWER